MTSASMAIASVIPIAVGAILAHLPTTAIAAGLTTLNTDAVLVRFTAGWLTGVAAVTAAGLLLVDTVVLVSDSSTWVVWVSLVLGIGLILLGVRRLVQRLRNGPATDEPGWVRTARNLTGSKALGTAFLLGSVNPKSAVIALSAVAVIVDATSAVPTQIAAALIFVAVSSLGVASPALALLVFRERARRPIDAFVGGFVRHSELMVTVILIVLGVYLVLGAR